MYGGFYLNKLKVIGKEKRPTEIEFDKKLNVISGPSDTGKSYIFECIDYMLGAQSKPKDIGESKGYDTFLLQVSNYQGKVYTIIRRISESSIYLIEGDTDQYGKVEQKELKSRKGKSENISEFLLDLLGIKGWKLKWNISNDKREISFRNIRKICLVDEGEIITQESPIYGGQLMDKTMEYSLFKLLLSGKDDDELETIESHKTFKIKVNSKIELLKEELDRKEKFIYLINENLKKNKGESVNLKIEELTSMLNESQRNMYEQEGKRQETWNKITAYKDKFNQLLKLEEKFTLLNNHYSSDLKRLEFINEGGQLIGQLKDKNCPICENIFGDKVSNINNDFINSIHKEAEKILVKKEELSTVIKNITNEKDYVKNMLEKENSLFREIESELKNKIKPIKEFNENELKSFIALKDQSVKLNILIEEVDQIKQDISYHENKLKNREIKGAERVLSSDIYNKLIEDIKYFLISWGIKVSNIQYDFDRNDIVINGDKRKNHGKGYRAIYLAAFMLGLLKYCIENNKPHPRFILFDSPLTTYKGSDTKDPTDLNAEEIQIAFFSKIADFCIEKNIQVVLLDNKEPPESDKINHIHFTGNENFGRYGFYPIE